MSDLVKKHCAPCEGGTKPLPDDEAKSLLQKSTSSVKQIASVLGFTEANHFSNYFKKHAGVTPVAYRKAAR